jgi:hypothetical protein
MNLPKAHLGLEVHVGRREESSGPAALPLSPAGGLAQPGRVLDNCTRRISESGKSAA